MAGSVEREGKLSIGQHFVAGGIAGIVESMTCHPLDTIKVNMQVHKAVKRLNPLSAARLIMHRDGPLGFYRGLGAVVVGITPKMAIRFSSFEAAKTHLFPSLDATKRNALAGLVAGTVETLTAVNPTEVVKIRLQTDPSLKNAGHALVSILREEGVKGLYRGATLTVTRQAINQAVNFTVYHEIKSRLENRKRNSGKENSGKGNSGKGNGGGDKPLPSYQHFMIGAASSSFYPLINAPIDTLKTRVQSMRNKVNIMELARCIYQTEGLSAFYKGVTPRLIRIVPGQAVTFAVYEKASQWMQSSKK